MNWREYNPQNEINPQDKIGEFHNTLLEYFVENIDKISNDPQKDFTIINDSINLLVPKAIELLNISPDIQEKNMTYGACTASIIKSRDNGNIFLEITDFSLLFQDIWKQITTIVDKLTVDNIVETLSLLKEMDKQIVNCDLSDFEKPIAFQANSIARFSSAYWVVEKDNPNSSWIEISETRGGDFKQYSPPNWVYSDIKAAYVGALFTSNPLIALGGAAVSSALDAAIDYSKKR